MSFWEELRNLSWFMKILFVLDVLLMFCLTSFAIFFILLQTNILVFGLALIHEVAFVESFLILGAVLIWVLKNAFNPPSKGNKQNRR